MLVYVYIQRAIDVTFMFRLWQGYVTQNDTLLGTLTVHETVTYTAQLRLPNNMSKDQKSAVVDSTIAAMGLQDAIHTPIGNWHLRGLSGGEKRRVSIALEVLTRPRILFLDEPTSGLDRSVTSLPSNCITIWRCWCRKTQSWLRKEMVIF